MTINVSLHCINCYHCKTPKYIGELRANCSHVAASQSARLYFLASEACPDAKFLENAKRLLPSQKEIQASLFF